MLPAMACGSAVMVLAAGQQRIVRRDAEARPAGGVGLREVDRVAGLRGIATAVARSRAGIRRCRCRCGDARAAEVGRLRRVGGVAGHAGLGGVAIDLAAARGVAAAAERRALVEGIGQGLGLGRQAQRCDQQCGGGSQAHDLRSLCKIVLARGVASGLARSIASSA
jgi:hypothetical protein